MRLGSRNAMQLRRRLIIILLMAIAATLCIIPCMKPHGKYFLVDVNGERFVIYATDLETIKLALENVEGKNSLFPIGELARGGGGFNKPWSWHLKPEPVRMVEVSIELCDGTPSFVESELDYWLEAVRSHCPWWGRIIAASDGPSAFHKN